MLQPMKYENPIYIIDSIFLKQFGLQLNRLMLVIKWYNYIENIQH